MSTLYWRCPKHVDRDPKYHEFYVSYPTDVIKCPECDYTFKLPEFSREYMVMKELMKVLHKKYKVWTIKDSSCKLSVGKETLYIECDEIWRIQPLDGIEKKIPKFVAILKKDREIALRSASSDINVLHIPYYKKDRIEMLIEKALKKKKVRETKYPDSVTSIIKKHLKAL